MESNSDTVIVFDFDLTIIDCDSDPWVIEQLGATQLFRSLLPTLPWNTLMDKMMGELHEQGKTISDIEQSLKTIPLHPEMIRAIEFAFSMGCDLRIVSDANMFFITTILQAHGLLEYFTEIKTNPAFVDETGRLRIRPFHPFTEGPPHGCTFCPPNMCKGSIINEMIQKFLVEGESDEMIHKSFIEGESNEMVQKSLVEGESGEMIQKSFVEGESDEMIENSFEGESMNKKRIIYLGDGSGDFCPSLKLRCGDHVLPRKEYPLWKLIQKNCDLVKAEVHGWSNAKDVEDLFVELLKDSFCSTNVCEGSYEEICAINSGYGEISTIEAYSNEF
jgi:pyridoxal phosphate phosphatase PHOSPHO2